MDLDRDLCSSREETCAERVPAPLGLRNCWWYVTTIRFAARRGSTERDRARTARAGALSMAVHCQDALRTRSTENWCEMLITGESVKPLVRQRFWVFLQVSNLCQNGLSFRVLRVQISGPGAKEPHARHRFPAGARSRLGMWRMKRHRVGLALRESATPRGHRGPANFSAPCYETMLPVPSSTPKQYPWSLSTCTMVPVASAVLS